MATIENFPSTCINVEYGTWNRELGTWTWNMEYGAQNVVSFDYQEIHTDIRYMINCIL
jgi:hypothetical protein